MDRLGALAAWEGRYGKEVGDLNPPPENLNQEMNTEGRMLWKHRGSGMEKELGNLDVRSSSTLEKRQEDIKNK